MSRPGSNSEAREALQMLGCSLSAASQLSPHTDRPEPWPQLSVGCFFFFLIIARISHYEVLFVHLLVSGCFKCAVHPDKTSERLMYLGWTPKPQNSGGILTSDLSPLRAVTSLDCEAVPHHRYF